MRLAQGTTPHGRRANNNNNNNKHNAGAVEAAILSSRWLRPVVLMFACYLVGYLQGTGILQVALSSPMTDYDDALLAATTTRTAAAATASTTTTDTRLASRNDSNKGWTSIDVFYGTRNYLDLRNRTWFSQARQDELVSALLRHKRGGYFIDLAANDAVDLSNSLALERRYHWQGLCIEPNPKYWKNLTYRQCQTVGAIVGANRDEQVYFRFKAAEYGGIAANGFDNNARWQRESLPQSTVTLHEIFQRYHVPRDIDYLSLDVEGAETFILTAFPLQEYRIKLITAERLRGPIRQFLKNHSYEFVQRLTSWGESLWVHQDVKPFMNWTAMDDFDFPMF